MKKLLLLVYVLLFGICSCADQENLRIEIVVQPVIEKNTTNSFKVLVKKLTNKDSISLDEVEGITLNDSPSISVIQLQGEDYLEYYTYLTATETGVLKLPQIRAVINNEEITSASHTVKVVEHIEKINPSDVVLELTSNQRQYALEDTISLSLYEYSKFYNTKKRTTQQDSMLQATSAKESVSTSFTDIYTISGIKNLEEYLDPRFTVLSFDWDPFAQTGLRKEFKGEPYIRTLLFELKLLAKAKAKYTIPSSEFIYHIYTSESDLISGLDSGKDGTTRIKEMDNKIHVKSKMLDFIVQ